MTEAHEIIEAFADKLEAALRALPNAVVKTSGSAISLSTYVTVQFRCGEYDEEFGFLDSTDEFKFRVSDHGLPSYYGAPNFEVTVGGVNELTCEVIAAEDDFDGVIANCIAAALESAAQ